MKVLIFDSSIIIRKGLENFLNLYYQKPFVLIASSFEEVEAYSSSVMFDLVIIDINHNSIDNFNLIKNIKKNQPDCKILIFSDSTEDSYCIRCFNYGANGFLSKNCTEQNIKQSINLLLNGNNYFSKNVIVKLTKMEKNKKRWKKKGDLESLSTREFQIAKMLSMGDSNVTISEKLNLSMSTISTYKKRILLKTNTKNVLDIAELFKKEKLM